MQETGRSWFDLWVRMIDVLEGEMQPTQVFLPGESHGQRSLTGPIVQGVPKSQTWLSNWAYILKPEPIKSSHGVWGGEEREECRMTQYFCWSSGWWSCQLRRRDTCWRGQFRGKVESRLGTLNIQVERSKMHLYIWARNSGRKSRLEKKIRHCWVQIVFKAMRPAEITEGMRLGREDSPSAL